MLSVRRGYTPLHALPLPAMASVNAALFYCYCCQLALCAKYGGTSEMKIISELLVLQRDFRAFIQRQRLYDISLRHYDTNTIQ